MGPSVKTAGGPEGEDSGSVPLTHRTGTRLVPAEMQLQLGILGQVDGGAGWDLGRLVAGSVCGNPPPGMVAPPCSPCPVNLTL